MHHRIELAVTLIAITLASTACLSPLDGDELPEEGRIESPSTNAGPHVQEPSRDRAQVIATPSISDRGAPPIAIALGEPANLDIAIASRKQRAQHQQTCMQRGHELSSGFYGRVTYEVRIAPDGSVLDATVAESHALSPAVIECMRLAFYGTSYPAPGGTGAIRREVIAEP